MLRAHGDPTPNPPRRRRRRPSALLVGLAASTLITVPLAGPALGQPLGQPLVASPVAVAASGPVEAIELRATASDLWAAEQTSRAQRWLTFGGVADEVPGAPGSSATSAETGEIPWTNLEFPLEGGALALTVPGTGPAAAFTSPYAWPVPGAVTSPFGPRFHPILNYVRNHNGVDMTAACGTPIVAMSGGVVTRSAMAGGYGNLVEIDHGTVDEDRMSSRYAHLSVLGVQVGQRVEKGQQIGLAGTTGLSTGCHLHFEVLVNGAFVDPRAVLSGAPYLRLDTPMVPWTPTKPGQPPRGTVPVAPPTESGPLPELKELPLVPAPTTPAPTPTPTPSPTAPTPTPDPTVAPDPSTSPLPLGEQPVNGPRPPISRPSPAPTPAPTPTPVPTPSPEPTPAPTPTPTPAPTPDPAPTPSPAPTTPAPTPAPTPEATPAPTDPTPSPAPTPALTPDASPTATSVPEGS